nr:hypothetical protein K-LCC10_0433 [Kaumoebavirus]
MSATLVRSVPLSAFVEEPAKKETILTLNGPTIDELTVTIPFEVTKTVASYRAVLIYMWRKNIINVFTPVSDIYVNNTLYFSDMVKEQQSVYDDAQIGYVSGEIKCTADGIEIIRVPKKKKTIKREKSCRQM